MIELNEHGDVPDSLLDDQAKAALADPAHQVHLARAYQGDAAGWLTARPGYGYGSPCRTTSRNYYRYACDAWARSALLLLKAFS